jgi:hypothetical protein
VIGAPAIPKTRIRSTRRGRIMPCEDKPTMTIDELKEAAKLYQQIEATAKLDPAEQRTRP